MVKIAELVADARTSTAPTWGSDTLSLNIPIPTAELPPVICWSCEDTEQCRDCNGHGEFYTNSGLLADCRNCGGHGICLNCVEIEEECTGGYNCLCQLQAPCVPTVAA